MVVHQLHQAVRKSSGRKPHHWQPGDQIAHTLSLSHAEGTPTHSSTDGIGYLNIDIVGCDQRTIVKEELHESSTLGGVSTQSDFHDH